MPTAAKNATLFWEQLHAQRHLNKIENDRLVQLEDVTPYGSNGIQRLATSTDATLDIGGWWDSSDTESFDNLLTNVAITGNLAAVSYLPLGAGTIGNLAYVYGARAPSYANSKTSITGVIDFAAGLQADYSGHRGVLLHVHQAETGAVTPATGIDLGLGEDSAQSPRGYVQNLHVTAFDGSNATIKTQWSNDNFATAGTDIGTFTVVGSVTSQHMSGSTGGALLIGRYVRYVLTGLLTSITFVVTFAKR